AKHLFDCVKLKFGFDIFSVKIEKKIQYGTILTLKNYTDISIDDINKILSLEISFYVAETVIPTLLTKEREYKTIINALNIFKNSKNDEFIEHFSQKDYGDQSNLCSHAVNFVLFAKDENILIKNIIKITDILDDLGVIIVRQDVGLEQIFWGNMPLNQNRLYHNFVAKKNQSVLFFGSNDFFDSTSKKDNILFFTHDDKLFLLNINDVCPIFIVSPSRLMRVTLCNFLLFFYYKNNKKTYIFEIFGESELFVRSMGGKYYEKKQPINPFIYGTKDMMINLIFALESHHVNNKQKILYIVEEILKIPKEERSYLNIIGILKPYNLKNLISFLSANDVEYNDIIDYQSFYNNDNKIIGFNLAKLYENPSNALFMMIYLIESFFAQHDGSPMTIVISDISIFGKMLFNNPRYFKTMINSALKLNIMFVFNIANIEFINQVSDIISYIFSIHWRLFIFSSSAIKLSMKFCETFLLLSSEINLIRKMQIKDNNHFFFKDNIGSKFLEFKYQELQFADLLYTSKEKKEEIEKINDRNLNANELFDHFYKNKENI
ncbi:MAG: hypothetical protein OEY79_00780, partial [Anaplasmataceae bacterium]|nr:hypothetical protein [Anaplasmataceae bacterium]